MTRPRLRLGVVDQSPVPEGATAADAFANSVDLARRCEATGYTRYWVAEHHNTDGLAGSAPEILVAHLAAATGTIRVGTGGVMLTHYSPLKVAETFRVLHTLHPGRIDLGLGRAPGSDQRTAAALARGGARPGIEHYPAQVVELVELLDDCVPPDSPLAGIRATPGGPGAPEVWLLASSVDSASYAAHLGLPLSWAHFIAPGDGARIVRAYLEQFTPSDRCPEPRANVAVGAICAATDEEAAFLATSVQRWRERGLGGPIPPPAHRPVSPLSVRQPGRPLIAGSPGRVAEQLVELADRFGVDELLVVTITHEHEARARSYELLAAELGLTRTPAPAPSLSA